MINRSVIPAAGEGSRLLPITNGKAKELLTVNNKHLIDFSIDESLNLGIDRIAIITRKEKTSLNEHLLGIRNCNLHLIEQVPLRGLGHAVLQSDEWVNGEDFAVLLPDDIIIDQEPCLMQLSRVYEKYGCSVVGVEYTEDVQRYGIIDGTEMGDNVFKVERLIEKPNPWNSPSNFGIVCRYILTPAIFKCLRDAENTSPENVELTDSIHHLLDKEDVYAVKIRGERYDCGNIEGYRRAGEKIRGYQNSNTTSLERIDI